MRATTAALFLLLPLGGCQVEPHDSIVAAEIVERWPLLPAGEGLGQVSAVDIDGEGRVFVLQRGKRQWSEPFPTTPIEEPTVYVFDAAGESVDRWGAGQFIMPHGLSVDPYGKVWITDPGREQVMRFSSTGTLELTLGTLGETGSDEARFGRPTDVAFDGDRVLVTDGYLNGRIAIFNRDGRFLGQFGSKGKGPGKFAVPHSIAMQGTQFIVADRENQRIQWFDANGRFVAQHVIPGGGYPYSAKAAPDGGTVILEGRNREGIGSAVLHFLNRGRDVANSCDAGARTGSTKGHDLAIAPDGAIYLADVDAGRVIKLRCDFGKAAG